MSQALPDWAKATFHDFISRVEQLNNLLELNISGIYKVRGLPNLIEVILSIPGGSEDEPHRVTLTKAREEAELAESEIANGFPLLHAERTISLWSSLEALVRTLLVKLLVNVPDSREIEAIKKLRIQFGDYESLSGDEKYLYIIDLLEDSIGSRRDFGPGRFEKLFQVFGLCSEIDEHIRKDLIELYHVRNNFVHQRGLADRKIVDRCPWMNLKVNDSVVVSRESFKRYSTSTLMYAKELVRRTRSYFEQTQHVQGKSKPYKKALTTARSRTKTTRTLKHPTKTKK